MGLLSWIFGGDGGLTKPEWFSLLNREKLSDYLPWTAYDPETNVYLNSDNTLGMMWECKPLAFAGDVTINTLSGLLRMELPTGSIMQLILYADPYVQDIVDQHISLKTKNSRLMKDVSLNARAFFSEGASGLRCMNGIPTRNFRLFYTVKFPAKNSADVNLKEILGMATEILQGAGLAPKLVEPGTLLAWMRRMLNDNPGDNLYHYDDRNIIRKQALLATHCEKHFNHLKIDSKYFRCVTPAGYPKQGDQIQTNKLFGGIMGMTTDSDQIRTPFLYTLNIIMQNQKNKLHTKCNVVLNQQGVGSLAPSLSRKKEEYLWAVDELERGTCFYRVIPALWVFDEQERKVTESITRARRIWEGQDYKMQEDKGILFPLFISSLPFGLYDNSSAIDTLDRDHILQTDAIAVTMPVQSDFAGMGDPAMLFVGRKGQVFGIDLFDEHATNHNAMVCASSGAGKSFFINYMVYNYFTMDSKIRIIDIGGSYKKTTKLFGARYLDFNPETKICLNPFTNIIDPESDLAIIPPIIAQMLFSTNNSYPTNVEMSVIKKAVTWAYEQEGNDACVDTVYEYMKNFSSYSDEIGEIKDSAARLAFTIGDFTSTGMYGKFFNGKSNLNIGNDDFVVLELEELKQQPELFKVVTLQIINAVTQDLYLSDKSSQRLIVFDEAWQFLGESSLLKAVIEEGYRRARKYHGSFTIITQSILDMKLFGGVGDVIRNNSAFKFYLESTDFEKALNEKYIDYDQFSMEILKSTKTNKPNYSEIFMDTPAGTGVARLAVDPFSYYVFTSSAKEINEIETMVDNGVSYENAIKEMVNKYRS